MYKSIKFFNNLFQRQHYHKFFPEISFRQMLHFPFLFSNSFTTSSSAIYSIIMTANDSQPDAYHSISLFIMFVIFILTLRYDDTLLNSELVSFKLSEKIDILKTNVQNVMLYIIL